MRVATSLAVIVALLATMAGLATGAGAVERVDDGGFEAKTSCGAECANSAWSRIGEKVYFCETGKCGGAPAGGTHWVQFGGGTAYTEEGYEVFSLRGLLEQQLEIPAAPAALQFAYREENGAGFAELVVRLDGVQIYASEGITPGLEFVRRAFDVSAYAGVGKHDLRFEFTCRGTCNPIYLDNVSLDAGTPTTNTPLGSKCRGRTATIAGSGGTLSGTPGPDVIVGSAKAETVKAKGGDDLVCAGAGSDRIFGSSGLDILLGQAGGDILNGGPGADILLGGPGSDREQP